MLAELGSKYSCEFGELVEIAAKPRRFNPPVELCFLNASFQGADHDDVHRCSDNRKYHDHNHDHAEQAPAAKPDSFVVRRMMRFVGVGHVEKERDIRWRTRQDSNL